MIRRIIHLARVFLEILPGGSFLIKSGYCFVGSRNKKIASRNLRAFGTMIYSEIHDLLGDADIEYWADFGTLLGVVRDHGPIFHDDDIDYSVRQNQDLRVVVDTLTRNGYELSHGWVLNGVLTEIAFVKYGINVDFFVNMPKEGGYATYLYSVITDYIGEKIVGIRVRERIRPEVQELSVLNYNGEHLISVPRNFDEILEATYGTWRITDPHFDCARCSATCISRLIDGRAARIGADELRSVWIR